MVFQQRDIVRRREDMDGVRHNQGVVPVGQRVFEKIPLDHRDPGYLELIGEAPTRGANRDPHDRIGCDLRHCVPPC
jgi:hypothetical protein